MNITHVGTKVRICKDSEFFSQQDQRPNAIGEVQGPCLMLGCEGWLRVVFDDGYKNNYRIRDLEFSANADDRMGLARSEAKQRIVECEQEIAERRAFLKRIGE